MFTLSSQPATALDTATWPSSVSAPSTLVHVTECAHWEYLARQFQDYDYRQSWSYGQVSAEHYNAHIERVAIKSGSELAGLAVVRIKNIPLLKAGLAHVGGGPLTRKGKVNDLPALSHCLAALREEYLARRGLTLRILPPIDASGNNHAIDQCFRAAGFSDSEWPPPYRTILVDINRPLPEIRKTLAQKWRNCLNNSERQGLTLRCGNEPELFEAFRPLFEDFISRKQFKVALDSDFYSRVRAKAETDEGYLVCLAMKDGVPVAGHLISLLGDTGISLLAASSELGLKLKATYFVQWHVMAEARQRGMRWYDPGGIEPDANPGVYHFKVGLGGKEIVEPGPYQAAPDGLLNSMTPAVEKLYRWTLRSVRLLENIPTKNKRY